MQTSLTFSVKEYKESINFYEYIYIYINYIYIFIYMFIFGYFNF